MKGSVTIVTFLWWLRGVRFISNGLKICLMDLIVLWYSNISLIRGGSNGKHISTVFFGRYVKHIPIRKVRLWRKICGSFFLWLMTSGSQVVIKNSSNDIFVYLKWWSFHLNTVIILSILILNKKICHWLTLNDELRGRSQEPDKKEPQIPRLC